MNQNTPVTADHDKSETRHCEPLPKVIISESLIQERERGFLRLLYDPPDVDCIHVLGRSGPLAATGLYEDPDFVAYLGLPPMIVIDGIGNEVWNEWTEMMYAQDRDDEVPDAELGEYAAEEDRILFNEWVWEASSPHVQATITSLRSLPPGWRRIAILDDVRQFGNVTLGVAPAIYKAAYGDDHQYDPANNRYVFKSADWLNQIIRATFQPCLSALDDRQMKFLVQLSKGKLDWAGFRQIDPDDIHSLDQLADYCATWLEGYVAGVTRSETVYNLIQRYGLNLFQLHAGIQAAFRRHTHVCVDPKQAHLKVERRAPAPSTQHVDNSTITNAPRPAASVGR